MRVSACQGPYCTLVTVTSLSSPLSLVQNFERRTAGGYDRADAAHAMQRAARVLEVGYLHEATST